jgi:membrane-bound inhibitor of C-type lysozyme
LAACRNETQNRLRRNLQDFTGGQMYITLYTLEGVTVFEGTVDGKVTRSSEALSGDGGQASGSYVFWYDDRGRYHQSSLSYLVTSYDRSAEETSD